MQQPTIYSIEAYTLKPKKKHILLGYIAYAVCLVIVLKAGWQNVSDVRNGITKTENIPQRVLSN